MESFDKTVVMAQEAARRAGDWLASRFGAPKEMWEKSPGHITIGEDKECAAIYENFLASKMPGVAIFCEDGTQTLDSDLVWIIDPIDGTSNYRVGIPFFATQLCLVKRGQPVVSVIYNPILKLEFLAIAGRGSFLNGEKISVSEIKDVNKAMLIMAKGKNASEAGEYIAHFGKNVRTVRMFGGSTGLDLAYIASGKGDITINSGSHVFDYVPGVLLAREAGALAVNFDGKEWSLKDNNLIACNKSLMPKVMEIMSCFRPR